MNKTVLILLVAASLGVALWYYLSHKKKTVAAVVSPVTTEVPASTVPVSTGTGSAYVDAFIAKYPDAQATVSQLNLKVLSQDPAGMLMVSTELAGYDNYMKSGGYMTFNQWINSDLWVLERTKVEAANVSAQVDEYEKVDNPDYLAYLVGVFEVNNPLRVEILRRHPELAASASNTPTSSTPTSTDVQASAVAQALADAQAQAAAQNAILSSLQAAQVILSVTPTTEADLLASGWTPEQIAKYGQFALGG
jgi:hypothetical protein